MICGSGKAQAWLVAQIDLLGLLAAVLCFSRKYKTKKLAKGVEREVPVLLS